jgi:hypothetical protein
MKKNDFEKKNIYDLSLTSIDKVSQKLGDFFENIGFDRKKVLSTDF